MKIGLMAIILGFISIYFFEQDTFVVIAENFLFFGGLFVFFNRLAK